MTDTKWEPIFGQQIDSEKDFYSIEYDNQNSKNIEKSKENTGTAFKNDNSDKKTTGSNTFKNNHEDPYSSDFNENLQDQLKALSDNEEDHESLKEIENSKKIKTQLKKTKKNEKTKKRIYSSLKINSKTKNEDMFLVMKEIQLRKFKIDNIRNKITRKVFKWIYGVLSKCLKHCEIEDKIKRISDDNLKLMNMETIKKIKKKSIKELFTFWPNDTRLGKKKRKKLKEDRVYNKQNEIIFEKLANLSNFPIVKEFIDSSFEDVYKNYYIAGNNPFPKIFDDSKDSNTFEKSIYKFESNYKERYQNIAKNYFFGKDKEETAQHKENKDENETTQDKVKTTYNKPNEGLLEKQIHSIFLRPVEPFDSSSENVFHNNSRKKEHS